MGGGKLGGGDEKVWEASEVCQSNNSLTCKRKEKRKNLQRATHARVSFCHLFRLPLVSIVICFDLRQVCLRFFVNIAVLKVGEHYRAARRTRTKKDQ